MRITIIAVGKIRQKWVNDGIDDYLSRLKRFGPFDIIEVKDKALSADASEKDRRKIIKNEGESILSIWPKGACGIALDRRGKATGSLGLAKIMEERVLAGQSHLAFVIGGSHGLSPEVLKHCNRVISFGPNTFPHALFRVVLLEQIYRAEKIRAGEKYHK